MTALSKLVDLVGRHQDAPEVEPRVLAVLRSGRYIGGPVVDELERSVAALMGTSCAVGVNSGTDALLLALLAAGVGPGDEVIVPALSFFATAESVALTGAVPVLVDVLPDRPLLDPFAAAAAIGPKTRAIVPVHLFGDRAAVPADLPASVAVVDDAAQAMGAASPPMLGRVAALSFYPTKVLGAAGDGGAVLCADADIAATVRALGSHGMDEPHRHHRVNGAFGRNTRLDALQAAVLLGHLPRLPDRINRRRALAAMLDDALHDAVARPLVRDPGSAVPLYVVRHPRRAALEAALASRGIASSRYYPRAMGDQPALAHLPERCRMPAPNAARFCEEALAIPCHEGMDEADAALLAAVVRGVE
jgi:dTDP-4-amino-4,6-dideoxygalactose transaminase